MNETHLIKIMEKSTCLSQLHIQNAEHLPKAIKRTFLLKFPTKKLISRETNILFISKNLWSQMFHRSFLVAAVSNIFFDFPERSINDQPFINFHSTVDLLKTIIFLKPDFLLDFVFSCRFIDFWLLEISNKKVMKGINFLVNLYWKFIEKFQKNFLVQYWNSQKPIKNWWKLFMSEIPLGNFPSLLFIQAKSELHLIALLLNLAFINPIIIKFNIFSHNFQIEHNK